MQPGEQLRRCQPRFTTLSSQSSWRSTSRDTPTGAPNCSTGGDRTGQGGDAYFQKLLELVVLGPAEGPAEGWQKVPDGHVGQGAFRPESSPDSAAPRLRQESGQAAT